MKPWKIRTRLLALTLSLAVFPSATRASELALGSVALPNSGAAAAQAPFLQGLAALHSFWYDEAAELFREAQRVDPGFALAYWGEAMTYSHPIWGEVDLAAARAALAKLGATAAERAAKAGSERERGFLAAAELLFGEGEKAERERAYSEAMKRLHETQPSDLEAAAFYALSLQGLQTPGKLDPRLQIRSAAVLEEVFAKNPHHPGAAHYLIHAYDDPTHAPLGLRAARTYAAIAPAAHHALHMPSHIFVQLGMWEDVVRSNVAAYDASVAWVDRRHHPIAKRDFHSLSWLQYGYLQLGRVAEAQSVLQTIRAAALAEPGERTGGALAMMEARQVLEAGGALPAAWHPAPGTEEAHACAGPQARATGAAAVVPFIRGWAAAKSGDVAATLEAARELLALGEGKPAYLVRDLKLMERELVGLAHLAAGEKDAALAALAEAVKLEAEMPPPSGPPEPIKPAHELYAEILLDLGRAPEALEQFQLALGRTPRRTSALLGAARAAERSGKAPVAREHYAAIVEILRGADASSRALAEARAYLAEAMPSVASARP